MRRGFVNTSVAHEWRQLHGVGSVLARHFQWAEPSLVFTVSVYYLSRLQNHCRLGRDIRRDNYANRSAIARLGLRATLEGHGGCVNCLQWNESGTLLASGSDDHNVILWDAFRARKTHTIETGHTNNIFAVQFMPSSGDRLIVTGAGDNKVRLNDITRSAASPRQPSCVRVYSCHAGRVKRLAVCRAEPNLVWTAGEDGLVMQLDIREAPRCDSGTAQSRCGHALLNLTAHCGTDAEVKCIALSPARAELLAVGATDPFVRVFDRRYLRTSTIDYALRHNYHYDNGQPLLWPNTPSRTVGCLPDQNYDFDPRRARYFCAGHLCTPDGYRNPAQSSTTTQRNITATHVAFSPRGDQLLVNLGGEQIYLFDMNASKKRKTLLAELGTFLKQAHVGMDGVNGVHTAQAHSSTSTTNGHNKPTNGHTASIVRHPPNAAAPAWCKIVRSDVPKPSKRPLRPSAERLKVSGNALFESKNYSAAVAAYSQAICDQSDSALLFANRAAAYMKRNWDGDQYAALRDCDSALRIDPGHIKALFRLARCLHLLGRHEEALVSLAIFAELYPTEGGSGACAALKREIDRARVQAVNQAALGEMASTQRRRSGRKRSASAAAATVAPRSTSVGGDSGQLPGTSLQHSGSADAADEDAGEHVGEWSTRLSELEVEMRAQSEDFMQRFCGHCNTTTDIKEASFIGDDASWVCAGSDDGLLFIWHRQTAKLVLVLRGDQSIVNCLQPHPSAMLLATSGIESVVKLWQPMGEDGVPNPYTVEDIDSSVAANQRRMAADPFEVMLYNIGFRLHAQSGDGGAGAAAAEQDDDGQAGNAGQEGMVQCRQS